MKKKNTETSFYEIVEYLYCLVYSCSFLLFFFIKKKIKNWTFRKLPQILKNKLNFENYLSKNYIKKKKKIEAKSPHLQVLDFE